MVDEVKCPECGTLRRDLSAVCPTCGAPPILASDKRMAEGEVRTRLFKVLAILMLVMLIGEVVTGLVTEGQGALLTLLGEATRLLVLAGLMWGGGDITVLLVDAGHDLRVCRILLGRINAQLHRRDSQDRAA